MNWSLHLVSIMVLRKANITFGCIKRSIIYKIKEMKVYSLLPWYTKEGGVWFQAVREEHPFKAGGGGTPQRKGSRRFPKEEGAAGALSQRGSRFGPPLVGLQKQKGLFDRAGGAPLLQWK